MSKLDLSAMTRRAEKAERERDELSELDNIHCKHIADYAEQVSQLKRERDIFAEQAKSLGEQLDAKTVELNKERCESEKLDEGLKKACDGIVKLYVKLYELHDKNRGLRAEIENILKAARNSCNPYIEERCELALYGKVQE